MNSLAPVAAENRYQCVVIDDDPDICALISTVLAKIGVSSRGLSSAGALAGALKEPHPAVIFLDVTLDRSDAIDGIRILRQGSFAGAVQLISGKDARASEQHQGDWRAARAEDARSAAEAISLRAPAAHLQGPQRQRVRASRRDVRAAGPAADAAASPADQPVQVDLSQALEAHWLDMAYQPKVDLLRDRVVGAEGLARINHPVHGLLGPQSFLPGAPDAALNRLTEFVIKKAFLDWEVMASVGRNLHLAVNAPVKALIDPGLIALVRENHPRNQGWPGLIIEVTEDEAVQEFDAVSEAAVQLRIYNVTLAIDDFGSGYSSFARLKQFPFSEIKLDRSFVQNLASDQVNAGICQSIVDLARATGAECVAEGIETEADRQALIRVGCTFGQGYFFGRPMSVGKLIERTKAPRG